MKKFIYYIGILALCLLPAACSLEEESSTEVEKNKYEILKDYKNGFDLDDFISHYTDFYEDYDYIVGDIAYNKLRLKGFYDENNISVFFLRTHILLHKLKYRPHGHLFIAESIMQMIFWNAFL